MEKPTSDKNVWADFCAPTWSRYSYTYSANLKKKEKRDNIQYHTFVCSSSLETNDYQKFDVPSIAFHKPLYTEHVQSTHHSGISKLDMQVSLSRGV